MRTLINKDGVTFDAEKNYVFFAEDWNEVVGKIEDTEESLLLKANDDAVLHNTGNENVDGIKTFVGTELNIKRAKNLQRRLVFANSNDSHEMIIYQPPDTNELRIYNTNVDADVFRIDEAGNINPDKCVKGRASAGSYISLDGIKIGMASSGNRSFGVALDSGTMNLTGISRSSDHNNVFRQVKIENFTASTTFQRFDSVANMGEIGNTQEIIIYSEALNRMYRITCMVWSSYNDNFIIIERLF